MSYFFTLCQLQLSISQNRSVRLFPCSVGLHYNCVTINATGRWTFCTQYISSNLCGKDWNIQGSVFPLRLYGAQLVQPLRGLAQKLVQEKNKRGFWFNVISSTILILTEQWTSGMYLSFFLRNKMLYFKFAGLLVINSCKLREKGVDTLSISIIYHIFGDIEFVCTFYQIRNCCPFVLF